MSSMPFHLISLARASHFTIQQEGCLQPSALEGKPMLYPHLGQPQAFPLEVIPPPGGVGNIAEAIFQGGPSAAAKGGTAQP